MLTAFIEFYDPETKHRIVQPMHSFVSNFLGLLSYGFGFSPDYPLRRRSGGSYTNAYLSYCVAGSNDLSLGLVIGDSKSESNFQDYDLGNTIEIDCDSFTNENPIVYNGLNCMKFSRYFNNTTQNPITINEIGIFCNSPVTDDPFMITHDVLDTPVTINAGSRSLCSVYIGFIENFTSNWHFLLQYRMWDISSEVHTYSGSWETTNFWEHKLNAGADKKGYGILIGSGNTPPSIGDYCLENRLSTDWEYSAVEQSFCRINTELGQAELELTRDFTNNTGQTQVIQEIGIVLYYGEESYKRVLIARYVIDPLTVLNGQTATVMWTLAAPHAVYEPLSN